MSYYVLILESPGKIKKVQSIYPKPKYQVCASIGHIRDLHKDGGVNVEKNFEVEYVINSDKSTIVKNLKKIVKDKDVIEVILATDLDLEGEAIAESLRDELKLKKYKRITFNEITKEALEKALTNHRLIDQNMINAQKTRRVLDRLAGYKLSPLIQNVFKQKLGTGRVQSVIVRLVIDKEKKINDFFLNKTDYFYHLYGNFILNNSNLYCTLYDSSKENIVKISNKDDTILLIQKIMNSKWSIKEIINKKNYRSPTAPFITSTLQQEASTKFGISIKTVMTIAQKLYENGRITYMRTDSAKMSDDAHKKIKDYVLSNFGDKYYNYTQYTTKNSQEAHEAIRPTDFTVISLPENDLSDKIYQLIWKKAVSSQMSKAIFDIMNITIKNTNIEELMIGKKSKLVFDGYLKVYQDIENEDDIIEDITLNTKVELEEIIGKENIPQPPSRYNEATLVKKLESLNIGRPSTYAYLISRVQEHNYIEIVDIPGKEIKTVSLSYKPTNKLIKEIESKSQIGKEKKKMIPTEIGYNVTDFLLKNFPIIMDYKFTAELEDDLDRISTGKIQWTDVLKKFYDNMMLSINNFLGTQTNIIINTPSKFELIGKHTNKNEIYYLITKFGPAIKMKYGGKNGKDIFVNVKEKPNVKVAVALLNNKIKTIKK